MLYNTFCKSLDEGKEVRAVFCDISKAFDRVCHRGLLFKLESIGVSDSLLLWFKSYLADRKQRVVLPGAVSAWKSIKAGVPQGSILGPLLFLICINDIVVDIHSSIRLFADDTYLSTSLLTILNRQQILQMQTLRKFTYGLLDGLYLLIPPNLNL